jgi:hypothetical protein
MTQELIGYFGLGAFVLIWHAIDVWADHLRALRQKREDDHE